MGEIEYVGNDGNGFVVHCMGQSAQVIDYHAFINTFGLSALEEHILKDAEVTDITTSTVICTPEQFPQFSVVWERDSDCLNPESGQVFLNGTPFSEVSQRSGGFSNAKEAILK